MQWIKGFFKDTGDQSMGRLLSFITVLSAVVIACYGIVKGVDLSTLAVLCGTFLGAGIGGKVVQSFAEKE